MRIIQFFKVMLFLVRGGYNKPIWGEGKVSDNVNSAIEEFRPNASISSKILLQYQLVKEYIIRQVTPLEYFLFDFPNRSESEKDDFLPDQWKDRLSIEATGLDLFKKEISDKFRFYQINKPYFGRNIIEVNINTSVETFISFAKQEKKLFIKPLSSSYGKGAFIYQYSDRDVRKVFEQIRSTNSNYIAEGYIEQASSMSIWNESSVNTVRVPTILVSRGVHIFGCFMRTGRKGKVIDNAGGGGIFAAIDEKTGIVITDGYTEKGEVFVNHPDSHLFYKGFQVPDWQDLLEKAREAHKRMPQHKYIAYDFAYTDSGWIIIEGNWGQFLSQYATGKGLKNQFFQYMKET